MNLTLFLLSALCVPSAQQQGHPGVGLPHPSYPVSGVDDAFRHNAPWDGSPWWVSLEPSWGEDFQFLGEDLRLALLERVAGAVGAEEASAEAWAEATRPDSLALNFRILVDGSEALVGREYLRMGEAVAFSDLVRHAGVLDFDVEIASGAGIFDPLMGTQYAGSSLAVQVLPIPGRGWAAELAVVHSQRLPGTTIPLNYAQVAGKARLIERIAEAGSHALMVPGEPCLLELPNLGPGRVSVELVADSPAPAGQMVLQEGLVWLSLPTFARAERWDRAIQDWERTVGVWSNGQGDLVFHGPEAEQVAVSALAEAEAHLRPMSVDLRVQRIVNGVEGERSDILTGVLESTPLRFAQGTLRDALTEWDVEVAQISRIADPVFSHYFSGWEGSLVGKRLGDGTYEVALDLRFSVVDIGEPKVIRLAGATPGQPGYEGDVPASPAQTMGLETPEVSEVRFRGNYRTDEEGRLVLLRSANSVLGEGGRLRVELKLGEG